MLCNLLSRHIFVSVVMLFRNFDLCFVYCKVRNFYLCFCMRVFKYGIDFVHSFVPIHTFQSLIIFSFVSQSSLLIVSEVQCN